MQEILDAAQEAKRQKVLDELCPFDDILFRCMIKDNLPLAQKILQILLRNSRLNVVSLRVQADMKRLAGSRSLCMDAVTVTSTGLDGSAGEVQDLEVEGSLDRANPFRARYHSSVLDVEHLKPRQEFHELPETWTIFITEKDYYGLGKAFYRVERTVYAEEEETPFGLFRDRAHILYVNGEYTGKGKYRDIARLMHDFREKDPEKMEVSEMAAAARSLKTQEGDRKTMSSRALQELLDENTQIVTRRFVLAALNRGIACEEVAEITGLTPEEVAALAEAGEEA